LWLDNDYFGDVFSLLYQTGKTQLTFGGAVTKYIGNHYGDLIWAKEGMSEPKHRWYDLNAWKNDASTYAKWQQEVLPNFQVYTDLQFRTVRYRIDGFRDNPDLRINNRYNFFNPKDGISYHNNDVLAYASYSIGKKEPNRDDFEAGVNQLPKPERLHDLEIGLEKKNKLYSLGATFYYMQYKDQLVLTGKVNDVGAYTRTNIDNSYRTGIELQAAALLADWLQLSGNLTLSRNKVLDFTEFVDDYDNGGQKINTYSKTDIAFSPNTIGAATVKLIPIKSLEIDFLSKYVGKQYLDNTSNEARKLDKYFTEDVRVSYTFGHKFFKDISIIAQANNVFNKKYEPNGYTFSYLYNNDLVTENYYYPMAGFNWTFGLNVKF
jgi:iron complex outermembrane receptor protein